MYWLVMCTSILMSACALTNYPALLTAAKQITIIPSHDNECPMEPCYTLNEIAGNVPQYLNSNSKAVFLPGLHSLNSSTVTIRDVHNFTMAGTDSSTIQCFGVAGISFFNVSQLTISELQFLQCGAQIRGAEAHIYVAEEPFNLFSYFKWRYNLVTLQIIQVNKVNISQVSVINSSRLGLLAVNLLDDASITQCVFSRNLVNAFFINLNCRESTKASCTKTKIEIRNSDFSNGNHCEETTKDLGSGVRVLLEQSQYFTEINIRNTYIYKNRGYGAIYIHIYYCSFSLVRISNSHISETMKCDHNRETAGMTIAGSLYPCANTTGCSSLQVHIKESSFASSQGKGLHLKDTVALIEKTKVSDNKMSGLYLSCSSLILKNATITKNMGSGIISLASTLYLYGPTLLHENVALISGGGISAQDSKVTIQGNVTFTSNEAPQKGAAISVSSSQLTFCQEISYYFSFRGGLNTAHIYFGQNKAQSAGGLHTSNSTVRIYCNHTLFYDNQVLQHGGAVLAEKSTITIHCHVEIHNNRAGEDGGGILCVAECNLHLHIWANLSVLRNEGRKGGGLAFSDHSYIHLLGAQVNITGNYAVQYGGGIYINTCSGYTPDQVCFYTHLEPYIVDVTNLVWVEGNLAGDAGNALYGGATTECTDDRKNVMDDFWDVFHVERFGNASDLSLISSEPSRVCFCMDNKPNCTVTFLDIHAYPGETFYISAVTVGQQLEIGTAPGVVFAIFLHNKDMHASLDELQSSQPVNTTLCTDLRYSVHSEQKIEELVLMANPPTETLTLFNDTETKQALQSYAMFGEIYQTLLHLQINVHIKLKDCPIGFQLQNGSCTCSSELVRHQITDCRIENTRELVYRHSPLWISAYVRGNTSGVIVHTHCPFDYCKSGDFYIILNKSDEQCQSNRSGVLCGTCREGLNVMLGSSRCKKCSNIWLLLVLPFAIAGIILVAFLTVFGITISAGTISGLIFYANIVGANQAAFFPKEESSTIVNILYTFVAWLNLDLGIETCFYSGLDAYSKTWLQLLFPIYIWALVITVIVSSHYSSVAAKLSGRNAVPVLATLILLSYAKLLRFIITAFSFTILDIPGGSTKAVWLYDGNVDYLKGKHIPLFLAALAILLTISIPYTGVLLFFQCLQRKSDYKPLCFIKKYKPFFDAYMGPYRDTHRYWTGLLLLTRAGLFLAFSANVLGDPLLNLVFTNTTTLALFLFNTAVGTVYKSKFMDILEKFFLLNLGCYACATFYVTERGGHQTVVTLCSVGLTFVAFVGIVCYHTFITLRSSRTLKTLLERVRPPHQPPEEEEEVDDNGLECSAEVEVTRSHLRPLYIEFDQLREPVLEYYELDENQL